MNERALVIDNGAGWIKAGAASEKVPSSVFPTIIGRRKGQRDLIGTEPQMQPRGPVTLEYPIRDGSFVDFDGMEKIWHHAFYNELRTAPSDHAVLLTCPSHACSQREKMVQIMCETFDTKAVSVCDSAVLSLCSTGLSSGLVIDAGYEATVISQVNDGFIVPSSTRRMPKGGGRYLTDSLLQALPNLEHSEVARAIKHTCCYVAQNSAATPDEVITKVFELPDGKVLQLSRERFSVNETVFHPSTEDESLQTLIQQSILERPQHKRQALLQNIVVCGGTSLLPGYAERLQHEMSLLFSLKAVSVIARPQRQFAAWSGGVLLASLSTFADFWITRPEYEEFGGSIVLRKTFGV